MRILGIESSCDETGASVVEIDKDHIVTLLSNVVSSSMDFHTLYGGVVPEIAARSHIEVINPVIRQALLSSIGQRSPKYEVLSTKGGDDFVVNKMLDSAWEQIDAIAVTHGAGLGGCLLVGVMTARTLAIAKDKPLYACNHVEGHVYANFITKIRSMSNEQIESSNYGGDIAQYNLPSKSPEFPLLALIVSGGHSQLAYFRDHFDYTLLGQTQDDAIGEAFDKVAKMIGLPYPGGPSIAKAALGANDHLFALPKARMTTPSNELLSLRAKLSTGVNSQNYTTVVEPSILPLSYDFSFSGLKTAVLRNVQKMCGKDHNFPSFQLPSLLTDSQREDISATFQRVAIETVVDKTVDAYNEFAPRSVVIAGGVAANQELRSQLKNRLPIDAIYTDIKLCTDNGAMIASLGAFKAMLGQVTADPYSLEIEPNLSM